jgi:hypothetical protein
MPIQDTDIVWYASANMPEDDASPSGGAVASDTRLFFTQLTANAVVAAQSDGTDTRTLNVTGRVPAGSISTDEIALNGTTEVLGAVTYERLLKLLAASTSESRTVQVKQGSGGTVIATIPPNENGFRITFYDSASSPTSAKTFYEKGFVKNNHDYLTLTNAKMQLSADPSGKIKIGLATSKNDTASVANRLTAPSGITFVDDGVDQDIPGGTLEAGSSIGVWIEMSLNANEQPLKSSYTIQVTGTSV